MIDYNLCSSTHYVTNTGVVHFALQWLGQYYQQCAELVTVTKEIHGSHCPWPLFSPLLWDSRFRYTWRDMEFILLNGPRMHFMLLNGLCLSHFSRCYCILVVVLEWCRTKDNTWIVGQIWVCGISLIPYLVLYKKYILINGVSDYSTFSRLLFNMGG